MFFWIIIFIIFLDLENIESNKIIWYFLKKMVEYGWKEIKLKYVEYILVKGKMKGILNWFRKIRFGIFILINGFLNEEYWGYLNKCCWDGIYSLLDDVLWCY